MIVPEPSSAAPAEPLPYPGGNGDARLLSPAEVAQRLAISRDHVFKLMRADELPYVRIGRFYRVAVQDLDAFIASRRHHADRSAPRRVRPPRAVRGLLLSTQAQEPAGFRV